MISKYNHKYKAPGTVAAAKSFFSYHLRVSTCLVSELWYWACNKIYFLSTNASLTCLKPKPTPLKKKNNNNGRPFTMTEWRSRFLFKCDALCRGKCKMECTWHFLMHPTCVIAPWRLNRPLGYHRIAPLLPHHRQKATHSDIALRFPASSRRTF